MTTKERKHQAPPRYDEAFKTGVVVVQMVTEQDRPSREVAKELGICIDTLRSWLKAAGAPSPGQSVQYLRKGLVFHLPRLIHTFAILYGR